MTALRRFGIAAYFVYFVLFCVGATAPAATIRVTTWNLEWFPNGKPQDQPLAEQQKRIAAAGDVLRPLNSDVLLLQEVRDYGVCERLAEAIKPHTYSVAICSAFKEPFEPGLGKQQVAILAKEPAQAAWSESWRSIEGVDPPRGFAFAWFKINGADVGVYSVHLKSNLVLRGDKEVETAKNIRKREVAVQQLLNHIRDVINPAMPMVRSVIIGRDFNTDKEEFPEEKTLDYLTSPGFRNYWEGLPLAQRVTHQGSSHYPDATFDYLLASHGTPMRPRVVKTKASDHLPVTCDFTIEATPQVQPLAAAQPTPSATAAGRRTVVITRDTTIQIPYGTTVIRAGTRVKVLRERGDVLDVEYLGGTQSIPKSIAR